MAEGVEPGRFKVRIEGESIQPGKIAVRDLEKLAPLLQTGLERAARVLRKEPGGVPGRLPREIELATNLLLVDIKAGSAELVLELPVPADEEQGESLFDQPAQDIGQRAMENFVRGLHDLETEATAEVPDGWDNSLMDVAEQIATFATERSYVIHLNARPTSRSTRTARISPDIASRFRVRHAPTRRRRTARGELIAVDLRKGRIDVEASDGRRVQCQFDPEVAALMDRVKMLIGQRVEVSGEEEFDLALSRAGKLEVRSLEPAGEELPLHEVFWQNRSAAEQAREQGVQPIAAVERLAATGELTDEELDAFIETIQQSKRSEE